MKKKLDRFRGWQGRGKAEGERGKKAQKERGTVKDEEKEDEMKKKNKKE